jgi:hypothetical protein
MTGGPYLARFSRDVGCHYSFPLTVSASDGPRGQWNPTSREKPARYGPPVMDEGMSGIHAYLSPPSDAQPHHGIGHPVCGVADYIPFSRKVACDTTHAQRFDGLDVGHDRRRPFSSVAIEQSL